jgi:osmotically inducible lipoprotein OsmB
MRYKTWLTGLLVLSVTGCSNMNNTQTDAALGAGAGAGAFALLTRGNPVATVFGALFGGLIGGSIGHDQDRVEARDKAINAQIAAQQARQMSLNEIVQMKQQGQSDTIIINQIVSTGSIFALTSDDINYLRSQGVSDQVISVMQQWRARVVYPYGAPPPPGYVVVQPPPPPPPPVVIGVGVGGRF